MYKTSLIQLLKVTCSEEIKGLSTKLKFSKNKADKNLLILLEYVKKYAPAYESPKLEKTKVVAYLAKKDITQKLNRLAHDLKVALEDFLIAYDIEQDEGLKQELLLKTLKKRNHPDYHKYNKKLIEMTQKRWKTALDHHDLWTLFQLNYTVWSDVNTQKFKVSTDFLQAANQYLDAYYWLNKLKINTELTSSKSIIANQVEAMPLSLIQNTINQYPLLSKRPDIQIWLKNLQLIEDNNDAAYFTLKEALFTSVSNISPKDARDIFVFLNNYCVSNLNSRTKQFALEGVSLFKLAEKHQFLLENQRIRDLEYTNAVTFGLMIPDIDWTFTFINKYYSYLAPELKEATFALVNAQYHFSTKAFAEVWNWLHPVDLPNHLTLSTNIKIRTLTMRAFYEIWQQNNFKPAEEISVLSSQIQSFENYIKSNPYLAPVKKQGYLNFTLFFKDLVYLKKDSVRQEKQLYRIQQQLNQNNIVLLKKWLNDKIQARLDDLPFD